MRGNTPQHNAGSQSRFGTALCAAACIVLTGIVDPGLAGQAASASALPPIGFAPAFTLTNQDGKAFSLADARGKVAVVTFIFTRCMDTCPALTAKLVEVQRKLGKKFGGRNSGANRNLASKVVFAAITVDPENDTPEVLKRYAQAHGANLNGWAFLTGTPAQIQEVVRNYAIFVKKQEQGELDHTFLTSIIDQSGVIRVQYMGVRFKNSEFMQDLRSLLDEGSHK